MRIGLYVETAKDEQPTGIGRHVLALVQSLGELDRENEYLLYYPVSMFEPPESFPHCPPEANFRNRPVRFPRRWVEQYPNLWWRRRLPWAIARDGLDVFHGPNHFLPPLRETKTVVTIHDLAYFKMDDLYPPPVTQALRDMTRCSMTQADRVIALSQNTCRDVADLGIDSEKIRLIYGGGHVVPETEIRHERADELRHALQLPPRFILFVGTLNPRKNVPFLLRSFARMKHQEGLPHGLVLAGGHDACSGEILRLIDELGIASDVVVTGYVEDWQVPLLYKMADLFVLPSRYEGFTLVTIEAMAYGVPVIATDSSSIREGTGDAAVLVDLDDDQQLADAMRRTLNGDRLRRNLIEKGLDRARQFTWQTCARKTLDVYQELAGSVGPAISQPAGMEVPTALDS